jgi:hypothetical protein
MTEGHEERFIPERHAIDPLAVVKDYATVPRLEYRYVTFLKFLGGAGLLWLTAATKDLRRGNQGMPFTPLPARLG